MYKTESIYNLTVVTNLGYLMFVFHSFNAHYITDVDTYLQYQSLRLIAVYSGIIQPVRTGSAELVVKFRIVQRASCYLL